MKILLSGPPGTGKTHLGDWLAKQRGFFHLDMENWPTKFPKKIWDSGNLSSFVSQLDEHCENSVLTWGFPPRCLPVVRSMRGAGIIPFWFDAPLLFCRKNWKPEIGQREDTFIQQIVEIEKAWKELSNFYGDFSLSVVDLDFGHIPEEAIVEKMMAKSGKPVNQSA